MLRDDAVARLRLAVETPDLSDTRYRIVREIGRGGMGVVYEAEDVELQRRVALKVLSTEIASPEAGERMRHEARTIAALDHPAIIPIYDVGLIPDGRTYYVMKLVRGSRLDEYLDRKHPRAELLRVFLRACEAVAFAHHHHIIHRDLKPQNIMVGSFGEVLVMDWGLATLSGEQGLRAGTPEFMAPEQERSDEATPGTDVFGLGRILELILRGDAKVPPALAAVAAKATESSPERRFFTARELADDVARFLDGERVSAYQESVAERVLRWVLRNRALVTIVAAYLAMRVLVALITGR